MDLPLCWGFGGISLPLILEVPTEKSEATLILLVIYILNVALLPGPPSDRIPTRRHLSSLLHLVSTWLSIPSPTLARQGRPLPHVCQGFRPMFAFWLVALEAPRVPGSLTLLIFLWGYYLLKSIQYFP